MSISILAPSTPPSSIPSALSSLSPTLSPLSCHQILATAPPKLSPSTENVYNASVSSHGILFTLANPSSLSDDEIIVTSLGFYVDNIKLSSYFECLPSNDNGSSQKVSYQLYTLQGYYADPSRRGVELDPTIYNGGGLPINSNWDTRGNTSYWNLVTEGMFGIEDLTYDVGLEYSLENASYFQIPVDAFNRVTLPVGDDPLNNLETEEGNTASNDTVQSFYFTLKEVGALYQFSLENWELLNDPQPLLNCGKQLAEDSTLINIPSTSCSNQQEDTPTLQIGEGVVSYPFYTTAYFYTPRKFIGNIYLASKDCLTSSPTLSPTEMPLTNNTPSPSLSLAPSASPTEFLESYIEAPPNGCHRFISTDQEYINFNNETSTSYGILFPVQTNENDENGLWITSLGFYIDFNMLVSSNDINDETINYQVYTLIKGGYYADPNRIRSDGTPIDYDYRGNFTYWQIVAAGTISRSFLSFLDSEPGEDTNGTYFYQIPWDRFKRTYIQPNGGVQSFYLTFDSGSLVYRNMDSDTKQPYGRVQKDDNYQRNPDGLFHPPILLIGEGVIGYPFNTVPFLYYAKQFVGKLYYEIECPSESPSASPSEPPSTSLSPSTIPSSTPSGMPTPLSSAVPSGNPSISMMPVDLPASSAARERAWIAVLFQAAFIGLMISI